MFLFLMPLSVIQSQELTTIDRNGFSITFPNSWKEEKVPNCLIYILESETDKIQTNSLTSIGIQETKNSQTLEAFSKEYEDDLTNHKNLKDFKIKAKRNLMYGSKKAIRYFYTATDSHIPIEVMAIAIENEGKIILVTATIYWFRPNSKKLDFVQLLNKTEKILNSIKVE
ncbi:hypothetical protein [Kordia jejudonensis]|uniref:hypothetical protein n=1 Tax=Kordia jejudonensis TaxID=1348245 RepID=UPI00062906B8|nr:hypothetical protein [Kordia jejudonensis]